MSHKQNNILLLGDRRVGKSTILQRVLESISLPKAGIITEPVFYAERITGYSIAGTTGLQSLFAREVSSNAPEKRKILVNSRVLDKIGSLILAQAQRNADVIYMDELSGLMDRALEFQRRVTGCFDGHHPVLAVLNTRPSNFIKQLCSREDVILFHVTLENRDRLIFSIFEKLTNLNITLRDVNSLT